MPSGLIALLDDVATLTKLAAASVDDIGAATVKAGTKAAGVVIDDTAVTPRYVIGLTPDRELPIIGKIAVGSLKNKLLILLPVAMLLAAFAPWGIVPLLMIGGAYLSFEATEKIWEKISGDHHAVVDLLAADTPAELEARQVAGAIRTDFILSAEIIAIALASLDTSSLAMKGFALAVVAIAITVAVYGVVAIIVKLDDIGLHMAERRSRVDAGDRPRARPWSAVAADLTVGHRHRGNAVGRRRDNTPRHRGTGVSRLPGRGPRNGRLACRPDRHSCRCHLMARQGHRRGHRRLGRRDWSSSSSSASSPSTPNNLSSTPSRSAAGDSCRENRATGRASARSSP